MPLLNAAYSLSVASTVFWTPVKALSNSIALFVAAVPTASRGAVKPNVILVPALTNVCPTASIFVPKLTLLFCKVCIKLCVFFNSSLNFLESKSRYAIAVPKFIDISTPPLHFNQTVYKNH